MDVISLGIRNLANSALKLHDHVTRIKEERSAEKCVALFTTRKKKMHTYT
jgi:hypothetical protein